MKSRPRDATRSVCLRQRAEDVMMIRQMSSKVQTQTADVLKDIVFDGMTIAVGGFGLCGIPEQLIIALRDTGVKDLTVVSNNAGVDDWGLGLLLQTRQIRRMVSSYVGENAEFERQFMSGELELEFTPQGTLAERLRAGGAGIPGFYTKTGVGTVVAEGKETKEFDGELYVLERGIPGQSKTAHMREVNENLVYRMTARNFNPMVAMCGKITVAEVEHLVPSGTLDPDQIHTASIFVNHIVQTTSRRWIERTVQAPEWAETRHSPKQPFFFKPRCDILPTTGVEPSARRGEIAPNSESIGVCRGKYESRDHPQGPWQLP